MKKIIFLLFFVLAASSPLFAQFSIANFATGSLGEYDKPLIDAITYFAGAFYSFHQIALILATALGFIGIVWCSFKIIFGTENVRKAAVDVMCKFLLFTFVMALYPKITNGILNLSMTIGMHAGGGYSSVNAKFGGFRRNMEEKVELAKRELDRLLAGVADPANSNNKNVIITEDLIYAIVKRTALTKEEETRMIEEMKTKYNIMSNDDYEKYKSSRSLGQKFLSIFGAGDDRVYEDLPSASKAVDGKKAKVIAKTGQEGDGEGWNSPAVKHAIISLRAINEVFAKNPSYDPDMRGSQGYTTQEYLFDPFMRDKNGRQTNMLSPGAMIKIGVAIADIITTQTTKVFDEDGNLVDKEITTERKQGLMSFPMIKIQEFIFSFLFTIGMIAACVFCAIQYLMTIFEFFILTSVGIIFVPCILWDGTKSFAAKLVTLFLAYFFKLMLMVFCLFWVYGFFIDMGMTIITSYPVLSLINIGYFIFATLLGWVVTQNGPKLATTLLNGTPDLSMGEFMRAAGTAAAGAYAAKRAIAGTSAAVQKTGAAAHKGLQGTVNTFAGLDAMRRGVSSAVNAEGDKQGWSGGQRFAKTAGGVAGLIGQNVKNSATTFFTGVENKGDHTENVSNMGKGKSANNTGADGKQTYSDAKEGAIRHANKELGVIDTKDTNNAENGRAGQPSPPDTTPRFNGRRDTDAKPT